MSEQPSELRKLKGVIEECKTLLRTMAAQVTILEHCYPPPQNACEQVDAIDGEEPNAECAVQARECDEPLKIRRHLYGSIGHVRSYHPRRIGKGLLLDPSDVRAVYAIPASGGSSRWIVALADGLDFEVSESHAALVAKIIDEQNRE